MDLLAALHLHHGRSMGSATLESMSIASRALGRGASGASPAVRCAANRGDRSVGAVHAEAWRLFERHAKARDEVLALRACTRVQRACVRGMASAVGGTEPACGNPLGTCSCCVGGHPLLCQRHCPEADATTLLGICWA